MVSREELNRGDYVVAVPITSARVMERMNLANCVLLSRGQFGLTRDCVAQAEAIFSVSLDEIDISKGPIARLDPETLHKVKRAIANVIAL